MAASLWPTRARRGDFATLHFADLRSITADVLVSYAAHVVAVAAEPGGSAAEADGSADRSNAATREIIRTRV